MSGEIVMEPRDGWICWEVGEVIQYTDEEWVGYFGAVPDDECPICGRHQSNRGCGWWRMTQTVRSPA